METVSFKNFKYFAILAFYFIIVVISACLLFVFSSSLRNGFKMELVIFEIGIAIILIEFTSALITCINRKLSNKEVFSLSENGLENVYTMISVLVFFAIPTVDLIPWSAIKEFKLASYTFGRKYIVATIDEAKLSPNTSILFRISLRLNYANSNCKDLYFGSRNANIPAKELIEQLNEYHSKFAD